MPNVVFEMSGGGAGFLEGFKAWKLEGWFGGRQGVVDTSRTWRLRNVEIPSSKGLRCLTPWVLFAFLPSLVEDVPFNKRNLKDMAAELALLELRGAVAWSTQLVEERIWLCRPRISRYFESSRCSDTRCVKPRVAAFLLRDLLEFASFCSLLPMFLPLFLMFLVLIFFLQAIQKESVVNCWLEFWASPLFSSPTSSAMGRSRGSTPAIASTRGANPNESEDGWWKSHGYTSTIGKFSTFFYDIMGSSPHLLRRSLFINSITSDRMEGLVVFFLPCVFTGWSHHIPFITTRLPGQTTPDENCRSHRRQRRDQKEWIDRRWASRGISNCGFALPGFQVSISEIPCFNVRGVPSQMLYKLYI